MELKMSILKKASQSFGTDILAHSQPIRPGEKKDNKRVAHSPPEKAIKDKKKRIDRPAVPKRSKGRGFHNASTEAVSDMEVEVIEGPESKSPSLQTQGTKHDEGFTLVRRKEKKPRRKKNPVNVEHPKRVAVRPRERRNDAIRIKAKDETTYAEILSQMRVKEGETRFDKRGRSLANFFRAVT